MYSFSDIYSASNNGMTLKSGLEVVQDHWKWHHSIDRIRVPVDNFRLFCFNLLLINFSLRIFSVLTSF